MTVATEIILLETERELDRVKAQRDKALWIINQVLSNGGQFTIHHINQVLELETQI